MRVMGVDPGLAMTGFGIVETLPRGGRACNWGTIRTERESPLPFRLKIIYDELKRLVQEWEPGLLVLEEVFVLSQFPKAAVQLGEVRGVVHLAAQESGLPVLEIRPTEVKSALTGSGRADKEQIKKTIQRILNIDRPIRSPHAGDALALALTGLTRNANFRW